MSLSPDPFSINLSTDTPGEDVVVSAEAVSYTIDITRSAVSWYVDGSLLTQGVGKSKISFRTKSIGAATQIRAIVVAPDGTRSEESKTVTPAEVDLVYESYSFTHSFYKGKSLLSPKSPVTITAVPHMKTSRGVFVDPKNLIYTWKEGTKILGKLSGTGVQSITIEGPQVGRSKSIGVEVSTLDGSLRAKRVVEIEQVKSQTLLYEVHPTLGLLFNRALSGSNVIGGAEFALMAMPYFYSTTNRTDEFVAYTWSVNGNTITNPGNDQGILTLRPESEGVASVSAKITGADGYLEKSVGAVEFTFRPQNI